jgi:hypothetical protein
MTTITTKTRLTALALAAATLTSTALTGAEARGLGGAAHVAPRLAPVVRVAPHVAAFRAVHSPGMGVPRIPVTTTCGGGNCFPSPAPVTHKPPPPNLGPGAGGGGGGGGGRESCDHDAVCSLF